MAEEKITDTKITEPENEGITFAFEDEEGNEIECRVLYFFHAEHNDKDYMVYTTGVVGDEGEEVSAARCDLAAIEAMARGEDVEVSLEPLTTDIEWAIVADTLKRMAPDGVEVNDSEVSSAGVDLQATGEN